MGKKLKGMRNVKTMSDISKKPSLKVPPLDVRIGRGGFGMGRPMVGGAAPAPKEEWRIEHPPKKPEKIKPPEVEKDPLVDVFDENSHILVTVDLSGIRLPDDFPGDVEVDEITEVSFKNNIFGIKLRKKKPERLKKEKVKRETIPAVEKGVTAKVKKRIMLELKKQMKKRKG